MIPASGRLGESLKENSPSYQHRRLHQNSSCSAPSVTLRLWVRPRSHLSLSPFQTLLRFFFLNCGYTIHHKPSGSSVIKPSTNYCRCWILVCPIPEEKSMWGHPYYDSNGSRESWLKRVGFPISNIQQVSPVSIVGHVQWKHQMTQLPHNTH